MEEEEEEEEKRRETGREWGRCSMKKRRRRGREGVGEGSPTTLQCVYVVCVVSGAVYVQF